MTPITDLPGSRPAIAWGLWCLVFNDTKEALHCHHCPDEDDCDEEIGG